MTGNEKRILSLVKQARPANPLSYVRDIVKDYSREVLDDYILQHHVDTSRNNVKSITKGNANADIMVISESVSEDQLRLEKDIVYPMEGTRGLEMLETVFDYYHVNPDEIFYTNAVHCYPHKEIDGEILSRTPNKKEVEEYRVYLDYAIDIVRPSLIILLGSVALNLFKKEAISKARGTWLDVRGIPAMATYHPEYFVQIEGKKHPDIVQELKIDFTEDIKNALLYIQNTFPDNNVLLEKIEEE